MTTPCQPFLEPLRVTLLRTVAIAAVVGAALAAESHGGLRRWPLMLILVLWVSFGGHWVELWYLNWLRPRLNAAVTVQAAARIGTWYLGGCILVLGMCLTATALDALPPARWPRWWLGGLAFIGIELLVHLVLQLRGKPSFYNGRG
jgi:hypothetical protein